jgi:hypothetical protein
VLNPLDTRMNRFGRWSGSIVGRARFSSPDGQIRTGLAVLEILAISVREPTGLTGSSGGHA